MKKLMLFLMVAIPILVIMIVKLTATVAVGDIFVSVENVNLSETYVSAQVGEELDLSCSIYPKIATNQDVSWLSSNEQAAVVDNYGHVKFIGIGTGSISVVTTDGNKRSECEFYVWDTRVHKVELVAPQLFVHIGAPLQLYATVLPDEALNKDVVYSSDKEDVATVDTNGLVHGISEGTARITVTTVDGGYTKFVDISVIKPVTSLTVESNDITTSSATIQIEYNVYPSDATNQKVTFEVDDPSIAEVNHSGLVTFKQRGQVCVTLKTVDGGFEQQVKIHYTDGYAESLTLASSIINMNIDDPAMPIEYKTIPEVLYNTKVEFFSYTENIAYVDASGYLHAVSGGQAMISIRVKNSETTYIEKQILVNVESPAKDILIDDLITAEKTCKLTPKSLPEGSTNTSFFYHINNSPFATVSQDGLVVFDSQTPCTVTVTIYANEDNGEVSKDIKITYTAGMASAFELIDKSLTLMYGETTSINYTTYPESVIIKPITLSVAESNPVTPNGKVVEIVDGKISAVGGGMAKVKVLFLLYDGTMIEDYCQVEVLRNPEEVLINLDLQFYEGRYVTSEKLVTISGTVLPVDSTDKNIVWSVSDKNVAVIRDNVLIFNQVGYITLTATAGDVSEEVEIYYTGTKPLHVEAKAIMNGVQTDIPKHLMYGDTFEIVLVNLIPKFSVTPAFSIQIKNQKTSNPSRVVLETNGNMVRAVAGGSATIVLNIANTIRLNFEVTIERLPEEILVLQANTKVSLRTIDLVGEVLPFDTTNQGIRYVVHNTEIATIEGTVLTFKSNGVANITAICEADENVKLDFVIEKIEKETILVSPEKGSVKASVGDLIMFDIGEFYELRVEENISAVGEQEVVAIEGSALRAVSAGTARVSVNTNGKNYEVEVSVGQLVEDIIFNTQLDVYDDEYLVGSDVIDLNFEVLPSYAENKELIISIIQAVSTEGGHEKIAYKNGNKLHFTKAGYVVLEVKSQDGNCVKSIRIRYTGGDAIDATLNVEDTLSINVGEQFKLEVLKWLPYDTTNKRVSIYESSTSGKKLMEVNSKDMTITPLHGGVTKLVIELSSGIVKEVEITCINKVVDIDVETEVYTASDTYKINAKPVPSDVTNGTLEYILCATDIAKITGNVLTFTKAGTVTVIVRSTDGTNVEKIVNITSTKGHIGKIVLKETDIQVLRGRDIILSYTTLPADATINFVKFRIISQTPLAGNSQVITLNENGMITATGAGSAVVRVYSTDFYGSEVYADCNILVYTNFVSMDVEFGYELDTYQNQNTFVTSRSEIPFRVVCQPEDAVVNFDYEISDSRFAKIEGNKIIFLQTGRVTIKFKCADNISAETSKTYSFYYVGNNLWDATLDKTQIENNVLTLKAGESFKFKLSTMLPSDNQNITFSIADYTELRNDPNKPVAAFEDGELKALNGGTFTFKLYANGLLIEKLTLIVTRDAIGIEVEDGEEIFVSVPYYKINAHVVESDSNQTIAFKLESDIAGISPDGNVTFSRFGECYVTVYVVENPQISMVIKITYTKELQRIEFNKTRDAIYVGEYIDLIVSAVPLNSSDFEYTISYDNHTAAQLNQTSTGYRLIGMAGGTVTVTARVVGRDIEISKTFNIYERIRNISLELDAAGDKSGHGGYRVFGKLFFGENKVIENKFTMKYTMLPAGLSAELLEWTTSNDQIAIVDDNGVVTFLGTGRVTITVKQRAPYDGAHVVSDSYEFVVVDGINVYNFDEFALAHDNLTNTLNKDKPSNYTAMVLQNDIVIGGNFAAVGFNYNVYGNGKMLDHSNFPTSWSHFVISRSNIEVDNVILRGVRYSEGAQLKDTGNTLVINNSSGVLIYNTIIENAENAVRIEGSQAKFDGCIFRNCLLTGMKVARTQTVACDITIKDSIFASSVCGILFIMDKLNCDLVNKISLEGEVQFYNWATVDDLEQVVDLQSIVKKAGISLTFVTSEIFRQLKGIATAQGVEYAYNADGKTYYNFAGFGVKASLFSLTYASYGVIDKTKLNPSCNYSDLPFKGSLELVVVVPIEGNIFSLPAGNKSRYPGDTYVGNNALLSKIKQRCRF